MNSSQFNGLNSKEAIEKMTHAPQTCLSADSSTSAHDKTRCLTII